MDGVKEICSVLTDVSNTLFDANDDIRHECAKALSEYIHQPENSVLTKVRGLILQRIEDLKQQSKPLNCKKSFAEISMETLGQAFLLDAARADHIDQHVDVWAQLQISNENTSSTLLKLDMSSPLISSLLQEWTDDLNKQMYIINWVKSVQTESERLPDAFPLGLQIVGLNQLLKEGFVKIIVPLVVHTSRMTINVFLRRRLREESGQNDSAQPEMVYDLRIKVVAPVKTVERISSSSAKENSKPAEVSGWFSGILQAGTDLLEWVNQPAPDNSYLEEQEKQAGVTRKRSSSGHSLEKESNSTTQRSIAQRQKDRAWSMEAVDTNLPQTTRSSVTGMMSTSSPSGVLHVSDQVLGHYDIGVPLPAYMPPIISREYTEDYPVVPSDSYVAPTKEIAEKGRIAETSKGKSPLSVVEAKLKAMRKK